MSPGSILFLAIGLAMDAAAAAAMLGTAATVIRARHVLLVAALFGGFQVLMPLLGFLIGKRIGPGLQAWDHWIAFALLTALGVKMLLEARANRARDHAARAERADAVADPFGLVMLVGLAFATSIDAFAVGVTLPMLDVPLLTSLVTIGSVTALLSALGLFAGRRVGSALGSRFDFIGGGVLIALGTKILIEHLSA